MRHHQNAVGFTAQGGDRLDRFFPAHPALKTEWLHAHHDDFRPRFPRQLDKPFRQGHASRSGQSEHKNKEITPPHDMREPVLLLDDNFPGQFDIAITAESMHHLRAQQMTVWHDRTLNRQLVRIKDPKVLPRTPVQHQLIAHSGPCLAEAQDAHAVGKKVIDLFRKRTVLCEFNHGFLLLLDQFHARQSFS